MGSSKRVETSAKKAESRPRYVLRTSFWEASCLDKFSSTADRMRVRILCQWTRSLLRRPSFFSLNSFSLDSHTSSPFPFLFVLSLFPHPRLSRSCVGQVTGAPALVTSPRINSRSGLGVCNRRPVARASGRATSDERRACSPTWRCIARCPHASSGSRHRVPIVPKFMSTAC